MTILDEPALLDDGDLEDALAIDHDGAASTDSFEFAGEDPPVSIAGVSRQLLATGLASTGTALVVGGIFGSWTARIICVVAAWAGTAWVFAARRSRNPAFTQVMVIPALLALGFVTLIGTSGGGPNELPRLIGEAIDSGRLFRPPVPFDPGWRPMLVFLIGLLAFGAGSIGVVQGKPKVGVGITVPLTVLALISQPEGSAFLGGIFAFLPILGALAVLFGDDGVRASELSRDFEAKRAIRAGLGALVIVTLLFGVNSADFLFPDPVYNPEDQPQKPRAVPLSASRDRVLFEVLTDTTLTGPWRIGALDVYADDAFQSVFSVSRLEPIPPSGTVSNLRTGRTPQQVTIAVRDLGDQSQAPIIAGTTVIEFASPADIRFDPRYEVLRVPTGRVPRDMTYTMTLPPYATGSELEGATPGGSKEFEDELAVPDPPAVIRGLLRQAPPNPWLRLDFLRQTLLDRVVASGAGAPTEVSPERAAEIMTPHLVGSDGETAATDGNEATPFEIVAIEALLARWAGVPSRVGFGFDGLNVEDGLFTVRPRNSAQWLEVNFEGFGWVPLVGQPDQAKATLDNDPNARDTPEIEASADVAVQVYIVYERSDFRLLYRRIRDQLLFYGPFALIALLAYAVYPAIAKQVRANRRRRWAAARGPLAQVAVEYAEFRDVCIDLGVGDDFDTPLEYYFKIKPDREHEELAWLVARGLYGDLSEQLTADDVLNAAVLSRSLRARMMKAQPIQSQVLAFVSRASIEVPYTAEFPNIRVIRIYPLLRRTASRVFGPAYRAGHRVITGTGALARRLVEIPRDAVLRRLADSGERA